MLASLHRSNWDSLDRSANITLDREAGVVYRDGPLRRLVLLQPRPGASQLIGALQRSTRWRPNSRIRALGRWTPTCFASFSNQFQA